MREKYTQELQKLHQVLSEMGKSCAKSIGLTCEGLHGNMNGTYGQLVERGEEIHDMERSVEAKCIQLLLLQQPVATDLRRISSAMKIATDLGRIGDNTVDIAEILQTGNISSESGEGGLVQMAEKTLAMIWESVEAFIEDDQKKAETVIGLDDEIDRMFAKIRIELGNRMIKEDEGRNALLDLLMIAKYYERMADHAVNVAKWVLYSITGKRFR